MSQIILIRMLTVAAVCWLAVGLPAARAAVITNGSVIGWGSSASGQTNPPADLTNALAVAAGQTHSLALRNNGTVAAWGGNGSGQITVPASATNIIGIAAGWNHSLAVRSNGTVIGWGYNLDGEATNSISTNLINVTAVSAGSYHSMARRSDGTVACWGNNGYFQCNVPANAVGVIAVAAGESHSLALRSDGRVVAWGNNGSGKATPPGALTNGTSFVIAIAAGLNHSLALLNNGTVVGWGDVSFGKTTSPAGLSGVVAIAAGFNHNLALKSNGTVVGWGYDSGAGQTNPPAGLAQVVWIAAGEYHSLAVFLKPPVITTPPASQTNVVGATVPFSVTVSGSPPFFYQWRKGGTNLPGQTNLNFTINSAVTNDADSYTVIVTNLAGSVTSSVAALTIYQPPVIDVELQSLTVNAGSNVTFRVTARGTAPLSYRWRTNAVFISGATATNYNIPNAQPVHAVNYTVVITNLAGSITSQVATLTVNVRPVVTTHPKSQTNGIGANVSFTVAATGTAPLSYQWRRNSNNLANGGRFSGVTTTNLVITGALTNDAGFYQVTVSNAAGSTNSTNAVLTFFKPLKMLAPLQLATNKFRLQAGNSDGSPLETQRVSKVDFRYSTNAALSATNWIKITNSVTLTNGFLRLDDTNAIQARRFYITVEKP